MNGLHQVLHEATSHSDPKVIALMIACGVEGYGLFWILVEKMMLEDSNRIGWEDLPSYAYQLHVDLDRARDIVNRCIAVKLFEQDAESFWCPGLNKRLDRFRDKRDQTRAAANKRWGSRREKPSNDSDTSMQTQCGSNADALRVQCATEKEKEIQTEKETEKQRGGAEGGAVPPLPPSLESLEVQAAVLEWLTYRRERRQPFTKSSLKQLFKRYDGNPGELVADIRHSIGQGWQGIYAAKNGTGGTPAKLTNAQKAAELTRKIAAEEAKKTGTES